MYRRRHRVRNDRDFQRAYRARIRKAAGPLILFIHPNEQPEPRLGLGVGRRVGNAVKRNRIKRLLREAFRLEMPNLPRGFDLVISVRPHTPLRLDVYRTLIVDLARAAARQWQRNHGE